MARRINARNIPPNIVLNAKQARFVCEYVKDFSPRRAAEASGHQPDSGHAMLKTPAIEAAIDYVCTQALESAGVDAEWVLMEMVDNHTIARQTGNITASNTALNMIAKHTMVDAMASDKLNLNVHSDKDITAKLQRGRQRLHERGIGHTPSDTPKLADAATISFL